MKIALAGCGTWGKYILRDLLSLKCQVVVLSRSEQSAFRARELGASEAVCSIQELRDVQGAVIATPSSTHFEYISQFQRWNPELPLFTEKPICTSREQADSLCEFDLQRIFVMDKWRYHPGVLKIAAIASEGTFGPLVGLKTMRMSVESHHADSNVVFHLLTHDLSIAQEIFGEIPQPVAARVDSTGQRIRGMVALLGNQPWLHCEVSDRFESHFREIRAMFEKAVVVLTHAYSKNLRVYASGDSKRLGEADPLLIEISEEMPLFSELRAFISFLSGDGPPPKSSAREGIEVVRRIEDLISIARPS